MGFLDQYSVPVKGYKTENYREFNFYIEDEFLSYFPNSQYKKASLNLSVLATKTQDFIIFELKLTGTINTQCDRCLDNFDQNIENTMHIHVTTREAVQEDGRDIIYISEEDTTLNIAQIIYEFIHLSVPLKTIHPNDANGNSTCNADMLQFLEGHKQKRSNDTIDPRWEKLRKFRDKN